MTNDFTSDELAGRNDYFANDDEKYGNEESGDGSKYRCRGFFGLRGRRMYKRLQNLIPEYQSFSQSETVALVENAMKITALQWKNPNLLNGRLSFVLGLSRTSSAVYEQAYHNMLMLAIMDFSCSGESFKTSISTT